MRNQQRSDRIRSNNLKPSLALHHFRYSSLFTSSSSSPSTNSFFITTFDFSHPTTPLSTFQTKQLNQNDWRQIWRQGQLWQERAIVSIHPFLHQLKLLGSFDASFSSRFHLQYSFTNALLIQPLIQGWFGFPRRSCPPSLEEGQLRSACWCW